MASPSAVVLLVATLVFTSGAIAATDLNFFYYVLSVCTSSIFLSAYIRGQTMKFFMGPLRKKKIIPVREVPYVKLYKI